MVWFRVDDSFWSHPKVLPLSGDAVALWIRAGSYCAQQLTDGHVSPQALRMLGDRDPAVELANAGLWDVTDSGGFQFHDWADYQPTRAQVLAERASSVRRQELSRNPRLRDAIRERDGDFCRYCGKRVNWADRKSDSGGTYDQIDPALPRTFDNTVVACRGCSNAKDQKSAEAAGMILLRPRSVSRSDLVTGEITTPSASAAPQATPPASPFCEKHTPQGPGGKACRGCADAKMAFTLAGVATKKRPASQPFTVKPGALCADGQHVLVADGTCTRCEYREERSA